MSESGLRECPWCGRLFLGKTARATYCCSACRSAAFRARESGCMPAVGLRQVPMPAPVSAEDVAGAALQARGAQATFEAGALAGPSPLRGACRRIADGIGAALDGEGL